MVEGVLLKSSSIISQDQSFIHFLYIFVMNYELLGWANRLGWANGLGQRAGQRLGYWTSLPGTYGHKN